MNTLIKLVTLLTALALTACGSLDVRRGDAPWDPKPGHTLMDQIPAWEGAALEVCCGHLRSCKPNQSPRC